MSTNSYHRIRFNGQTIYLRNMTGYKDEHGLFIEGDEVTKDGDLTDRYHIISRDLVTKITPMRLDRKYATLLEETQIGGLTDSHNV